MISVAILSLFCSTSAASRLNAEERLFARLFDENRYDKRARPVRDSLQPANVSFRYEFDQLYDINEKTQTICILTSIYEAWYDYRLYWNPSEYENLTSAAVDYDSIWIPDTTLYNSVVMYRPSVEAAQKAILRTKPGANATLVDLSYDTRHTVGCRFNMRYFPFDTQNCTFMFGSWSHDQSMLDFYLPLDSVSMGTFQENDAWNVLSFRLVRRSVVYESGSVPFTILYGHLVIKRKCLYYIFNLILPTLVIDILSSFALFVSEGTAENRYDKLHIGITTLLSYCVLFLSVSDEIPKGSTTVPLIGVFYITTMIQNALDMVLAMYISFPHRRQRFMLYCKRSRRRRWRVAMETPATKKATSQEPASVSQEAMANRAKDKHGSVLETSISNDPVKVEIGEEGSPEHICMIVSIMSTLVIAAAFCALGWSA